MNPQEFFLIANEQINDDPVSRLSPPARMAIDNEDCIIDIHTHIFDRKCLSITFILLRLLKSRIYDKLGLELIEEDDLLSLNEEELYKSISNNELTTGESWDNLDARLHYLIELIDDTELFGYDLRPVLTVLKKNSMIEVLDLYLQEFSLLNSPKYRNRPLISGVLLMDLETGWGISPEKKLSQQVNEIKDITRNRSIVPFFPLDPRRCEYKDHTENLYSQFLNAFDKNNTPFFGVKCYPSLGYLPSDSRLDPIFQICAEKNIPIMSHCGGEIVSTDKEAFKYHHNSEIIEFIIPGKNRVERASFLNDPSHWEPVLNKYNGLKLCFGHFGSDSNWKEFSKKGCNERIQKIAEMMRKPDWRVYSDFSYNVVEGELLDTFLNFIKNNPDLVGKILFGTDYWLVLPAGDLLIMQESFLEKMNCFEKSLLNTAPINYLIN